MRRSHFLAVVGLVVLGAGPMARAAAPDDLAGRIDRAAQAPESSAKDEIARARALAAEAEGDQALAPRARVLAHRLLAEALLAGDQPDEARAALDRAEALVKAQDLRGQIAGTVLAIRAKLEFAANKGQQALAAARQAEALLGVACPQGCDARADNWGNIGRAEYRLGHAAAAEAAYRQAVAGPPLKGRYARELAPNLMGLAQVLSQRGDEDESIATYYRAREAAQATLAPDNPGNGMIESELAVHLANSYRLGEAVPLARSSADFFRRTAGPTSFDTAAALKNMGYVLSKAGDHAAATQVLDQALKIMADPAVRVRQIGVRADAYQLAGMVALARHDRAAAAAALERGLALLEQGHRLPLLAADLAYQLAETRAAGQDWRGAELALVQAMPPEMQATPAYSFFRLRKTLLHALVMVRLGRGEAGWAEASEAARVMVERLSDPHLPQSSRVTMQAVYRTAFARVVDIAVATGHLEEAFSAAQWTALSELSVSGQMLAAGRAAADPAARARVRELGLAQNGLDRAERDANLGRTRGGNAAQLDVQLVAARTRVDAAIAALRLHEPDYFALAFPRAEEPGAVRHRLSADQAVMLPVTSGDHLIVLVATRRGLVSATTQFAPGELAGTVDALRAMVEDPANRFNPAAAWKLGRALFNPAVMVALRGVREVAMVGAGPLMTVPPGLLLTAPPVAGPLARQPYAIRRFAFVVRPLLGPGASRASGGGEAFLGVGAPTLGPARALLRGPGRLAPTAPLMRGGTGDATALRELPSLPETERELTAIAATIPTAGNRVLTGARATEAAVRTEPLERYGVIAFATHGLVSGELHGLFEPALVLTPPDGATNSAEDDGLLTASEAAGLKLGARWVILSACNTGAGLEAGAGGYSGLARGFLQAGAQSLLVSLWPLRDDAAARLTVDTVRFHARGVSQAEALRRAQLRLIGDRTLPDAANPAIWAPFSLVTL